MFKTISKAMRWITLAETSASAILHSLVSRFLIVLTNIITGIIVARTLGPAGRGAAAAMVFWPILLSGLLTLGVPAALRYTLRRTPTNAAHLFSSSFLLSSALGIVAVLIGWATIPQLLVHYSQSVIVFARWMMLFAPLMLISATLQAFYEAQGSFTRSNAMGYIPPLCTLIGLIALHAFQAISPYSVTVIYEAPFAVVTLMTIIHLRRLFRPPTELRLHIFGLWQYGIRAYGLDVLSILSGQIDQALVIRLLSSANFGLYAVAGNGSRILAVIGAALNSVLLPTASGVESATAISMVSRSSRLVFTSTLLAGLAYIAVLPAIIPIAYGRAYSSVIVLSQVLTVSIIFSSVTSTLTQVFLATGRPEVATVLQCIGVAITLPLLLFFVPHYGLLGAAFAVDISSAVRLILALTSFPIILKNSMPGLIITRSDLRELTIRLQRMLALKAVKS